MGDTRESGRRSLRVGLLAALAGATLVAAPAAGAHQKLSAQLHIKGTNHYHVYIAAYRSSRPVTAKGRRHLGRVTITAATRRGYAAYTARGRFTRHHIRADFGRFGKVALRFATHSRLRFVAPKSPQERHDIVCSSGGPFVAGKFRGVFRFRGEGGYTQAKAHRIRGELDRTSKERCHGESQYTELKAKSDSAKFQAISDPEYESDIFFATTAEQAGHVRIDRYAFGAAFESSGEFSFDPGLTSAHVDPGGGPFTGSADFSSPGSWTGSLTASFPGAENVPLTGPGFHATLRHEVKHASH